MDDPDFGNIFPETGVNELIHQSGQVGWREGVQIQNTINRHLKGFFIFRQDIPQTFFGIFRE